ncbi:MAG: hypothetical protein Q4C49_04005 [Bacillota bacterium]|nr:hypothetical protein [Bacillota bacterium]
MNKKHLGTLFAGIMVSSLAYPVAPIYAMDEYSYCEQVVITNATEFVEVYAKYQMEIVDELGQIVNVSNFHTEVTLENYEIILLGKQIYDQLPEETRAEIDAIVLENTGVLYNDFVLAAIQMNEQVNAEKSEEASAEEQPEEVVGPENVPAEEQPEVENAPADEETNPEAEEEIVVDQEADAQAAVENVLFVAEAPATQEVVTANLDMQTIESEVQVENKVNVETVNVEAQQTTKSADQTTAQNFVNSYCVLNGSIIKTVTTGNYHVLLNGYNAWYELSTAEKSEVNAILYDAGSQSFAKLYNAARDIRISLSGNGATTSRTVNTSVSSNLTFYSVLCMISVAVLALLTKKKRTN